MDRRDAMIAALELQWDDGLLASNLTILNQYVMALHHMSLEVLQSVLGTGRVPNVCGPGCCAGARAHRASIQMVAMVSPGWSGSSRAGYHAPRWGLPRLSSMSAMAVRLAVRTDLTGQPVDPVIDL